MMKKIESTTKYDVEYIVSQDTEMCGDCITCENRCPSGLQMMGDNWTPEEVAEVCALVGESNKYLSQLRSLEEFE